MLDFTLDAENSILFIRPGAPLSASDFERLAKAVDPHIAAGGALAGLVIDAPEFPGWESLGAMAAHFRFVRGHHKHIRRVASYQFRPWDGRGEPGLCFRRGGNQAIQVRRDRGRETMGVGRNDLTERNAASRTLGRCCGTDVMTSRRVSGVRPDDGQGGGDHG